MGRALVGCGGSSISVVLQAAGSCTACILAGSLYTLSSTRPAGLVMGAGWCGRMCCVLTKYCKVALIKWCMGASSLAMPVRLSWVQGVIFMYFPESRKRFVNLHTK